MIIEIIGSLSSPLLMSIILFFALKNKINIFDSFRKGAIEGFECLISILPAITALMTAVLMFKSSGAMDILANILYPLFQLIKIPKECIPLIMMKPISGSGTNAILISIFESNGPDSHIGKLSSIIASSIEPIFYILSIYRI